MLTLTVFKQEEPEPRRSLLSLTPSILLGLTCFLESSDPTRQPYVLTALCLTILIFLLLIRTGVLHPVFPGPSM